jgi:hypothetical protein
LKLLRSIEEDSHVTACNNINEDNESPSQREARHTLQRLTANDPAAARNMTRHMIAASILATGVRQRGPADGVSFVSGFTLTSGERELVMSAVDGSDVDHAYLAFDVDDACAAPVGVAAFRVEGGEVTCYPECALWSPPGEGRAVIIPIGRDAPRCHLVAKHGQPLRRVEGHPAANLAGGFRRAYTRLARLARSADLEDAHHGTFLHLVKTNNQVFEVGTSRVAA